MSDEKVLTSKIETPCDRLWEIHKIATQSRVLPEDVDRIAELSEGFMPIPPCSRCGEGHAEPEQDCPKFAVETKARLDKELLDALIAAVRRQNDFGGPTTEIKAAREALEQRLHNHVYQSRSSKDDSCVVCGDSGMACRGSGKWSPSAQETSDHVKRIDEDGEHWVHKDDVGPSQKSPTEPVFWTCHNCGETKNRDDYHRISCRSCGKLRPAPKASVRHLPTCNLNYIDGIGEGCDCGAENGRTE